MKKILIINPFGIGDVLFTTPVIRAIKEDNPQTVIGYWCNERVGGLLKSSPDISKVFDLSRGDIKRVYKGLKRFAALFNLIRKIRKEKFDIAFDFSLDSRYGLWSWLAGIKKRIGFDYKGRGRFLTQSLDLKGYSTKHVVEYYADLLKFISIEPVSKSLNLTVNKESEIKAKKILAGFTLAPAGLVAGIAMGGGASWGKDAVYKQWPAENFALLADRLIREQGVYVILLGSIDERPLADIIVNNVKSKNIADLTGRLSMEELAAIIKELKLLICNDGGPLHMAVALGVKTISIFGPVDDKVYGPYPPISDHIVIKKDMPCRPCYRNFSFGGCSNNRRCLENISVSEVYEKITASLRGAEGDEAI